MKKVTKTATTVKQGPFKVENVITQQYFRLILFPPQYRFITSPLRIPHYEFFITTESRIARQQ